MANTVPFSSQPIAVTGQGAGGAMSVSLGANSNVGRTIYLTGLSYQSTGATASANVTITATYSPLGNAAAVTLGTWSYVTGTTTSTPNAPLTMNFIPPLSSATPITGVTNTTTSSPTGSILITTTSTGSGALGAVINAWGYML